MNKNNKIHFIGIAGIGMSSLAEFLYKNYTVTGSDLSGNEITTKYDCPPNYPSLTKLVPGSVAKGKPDATKTVGKGADVVQICDGMNDSSGFLGIAPGRELHQMNPSNFSSSDGMVWRHVFIKA